MKFLLFIVFGYLVVMTLLTKKQFSTKIPLFQCSVDDRKEKEKDIDFWGPFRNIPWNQ